MLFAAQTLNFLEATGALAYIFLFVGTMLFLGWRVFKLYERLGEIERVQGRHERLVEARFRNVEAQVEKLEEHTKINVPKNTGF